MKQLMKRAMRRHGTRLMPAMPHMIHPRAYGVPPADAADVLEMMTFGAPLSTVLTSGDQDIVDDDDLGRALGVAREPDAEVWTSQDILRERDRHRWQNEE